EVLVELSRVSGQLAELEARLIGLAGTVDKGALSFATWLARATVMTKRDAHRKVHLAAAIASHDLTRDALSRGEVLPEQARVIAAAVDELPAAHRDLCEEVLLGEAAHHDAKALKKLGDRVLETVDQSTADAHEAEILDREERAAEADERFTMSDDGHGKAHGRFTISSRHAAMLKKALHAFAAPKHVRATGGDYDHARPPAQRMGRAFAERIESLDPDTLPDLGGTNATVVVTMSLETLLGGVAAASLDTGERITAGEARRLACQAGVIPAVLGTASEPLDLGRTARLHSKAQRLAVRMAQEHCQHPGCDVPGHLCHLHHKKAWANGGHTNTEDAELRCPRHHTWVHRHDAPMRE
ncbi:MAG: nuclease, partial [Marmoricola sp.]|nr:nuclease [Marmoricola sp.]